MIEKGNIVSFELEGGTSVYATVMCIVGEKTTVEYIHPVSRDFETKPMSLKELTKIGSHERVIKRESPDSIQNKNNSNPQD